MILNISTSQVDDYITESDVPTFIGASKDFATLTITGVKKTQKMSYMKSPACNLLHACIVKLKYHPFRWNNAKWEPTNKKPFFKVVILLSKLSKDRDAYDMLCNIYYIAITDMLLQCWKAKNISWKFIQIY